MSFRHSVCRYLEFEQHYYQLIKQQNTTQDTLVNKINEISKEIVDSIILKWDMIDSISIGEIVNEKLTSKHYRQMVVLYFMRVRVLDHEIYHRLFEVVKYLKQMMDELCGNEQFQHDLSVSLIKFNQIITKLHRLAQNGFDEDADDDEKIGGVRCLSSGDLPRGKLRNLTSKLYPKCRRTEKGQSRVYQPEAHVAREVSEPEHAEENFAMTPMMNPPSVEEIPLPLVSIMEPLPLEEPIDLHPDENSVIDEYVHPERMKYSIIGPKRVTSLRVMDRIPSRRQNFRLM